MVPGEGSRAPVKLLDFGISKIKQETDTLMTRDNVVMGTPNYMSPEQAQGHTTEADSRTDVFALGAILYEMFSGKRAFDADGLPQLLHAIVYEQPPANRAIPRPVEPVIRRCLAKKPEERYASVGALLTDLEEAIRESPSAAPEELAPEVKAQRPSRVLPTVGWLLSLAIVGGAVYGMTASKVEKEYESKIESLVAESQAREIPAPVQAPPPSYGADLARPGAHMLSVDGRLYRADQVGLSYWSDPEAQPRTKPLPAARPVVALSLSSDRRELLVGQADGTVSRWDRDLEERRWRGKVGSRPIEALALGAGYLAVASGKKTRLLSANTGKVLRSFSTPGSVVDLFFSNRNEELLLSLQRSQLQVIDTNRRRLLASIPLGEGAIAGGIRSENNERNAKLWIDFRQGEWIVRREYALIWLSRRQSPRLEYLEQSLRLSD